MVYCQSCGREIGPEQVYCRFCGARTLSPMQQSSDLGSAAQPESVAARPTAQTVKQSPLLLITAALTILVIILAGALVIQAQQYSILQSQYSTLHSQYDASQAQVATLQQQNEALTVEVQQLTYQAGHPTLSLWNSCGGPCTMSSSGWRAGGVPDTFDYYVSFTADVPVAVYFLTLSQYVQFANCGGNIGCVSGTYYTFAATTSLNGVFKLAEGCASYISVYQSSQSGTIYPNVSVTYNPASAPTC